LIVVSDTSPVRNLARIGRLDLLRFLYQQVLIPSAVYRELTDSKSDLPPAIDLAVPLRTPEPAEGWALPSAVSRIQRTNPGVGCAGLCGAAEPCGGRARSVMETPEEQQDSADRAGILSVGEGTSAKTTGLAPFHRPDQNTGCEKRSRGPPPPPERALTRQPGQAKARNRFPRHHAAANPAKPPGFQTPRVEGSRAQHPRHPHP